MFFNLAYLIQWTILSFLLCSNSDSPSSGYYLPTSCIVGERNDITTDPGEFTSRFNTLESQREALMDGEHFRCIYLAGKS